MKIKKIILIFNNLYKTDIGRAKILKIFKNCLVLQIKKNSQKNLLYLKLVLILLHLFKKELIVNQYRVYFIMD